VFLQVWIKTMSMRWVSWVNKHPNKHNYNSKIKHLVTVFPLNTPFSVQAIYYTFIVSNSNIVEIHNNNNTINDISLSKYHLSEPPIKSSYSCITET